MNQPLFIPRPRIVLPVAIVGHRENKLVECDESAVAETLTRLYRMLDDGLRALAREPGADLYAPDPPLVRLISALAKGADRLAIRVAPASWRLEAVLPMPRAEYARDFGGIAGGAAPLDEEYERLIQRAYSVTELPMLGPEPGVATDRARQYAQLGDFLVRQIDVLLAVWDGKAAAGSGGTALVVAQALERGRAVLWIDPFEPEKARMLDDPRAAAAPLAYARALDEAGVAELLRRVFLPWAEGRPASHASPAHASARAGKARLPSYFRARWPRPMRWAIAYPLLRRLGGEGWRWPVRYSSYGELADAWDAFFAATVKAENSHGFDDRIRDILLPRSIWADALAWYYGQLYRSAYVTTFILGGLAVPVGLCYLFFLHSPAVLDIKAGFAVAELALICLVVLVVRRGRRKSWHALWLETREISELLRLGRSLAYVGGLRDLAQSTTPEGGGEQSLSRAYTLATFREIGLPGAVLDPEYLRRLLDATARTEIKEQKAYHARNTARLRRIDHVLHRIGNACFTATIVVLLFYLLIWLLDRMAFGPGILHHALEYAVKPLVSVLAAGLPAFGAAFAGIRAQSDFGEFARRSEATKAELTEVAARIESLVNDEAERLDLPHATELLLASAHAMAADVGRWRQIFFRKPLALPS